MQYKFIAIEGNIGAGKTTLAGKLSQYLNARLLLEQFENNPFLGDFYRDPERTAFPLEMYFLAERYRQLTTEIPATSDLFSEYLVSDYFLEKSLVFARNNLKENEYSLFIRLYEIMFSQVRKPDLLIYLWLPVEKLMDHIRKRGRSYEMQMDPHYLENIQEIFLSHLKKMENQKILVLNYGTLDFTGDTDDVKIIVELLGQDFKTGVTFINL